MIKLPSRRHHIVAKNSLKVYLSFLTPINSSSPQFSFDQGPVQVSLANSGSALGRTIKYQKNMVKHCQERPKISMRFQGSMKYFFASPRAPMVFRRSSNSLKRWYGSQINRMTSQIVRKTSFECGEYNDRALYWYVEVTVDNRCFLELPKLISSVHPNCAAFVEVMVRTALQALCDVRSSSKTSRMAAAFVILLIC